MFYDLFKQLCDDKGVSPNKACIEMGLSRSIAAKWKNTDSAPGRDTLKRIADYFGVSMEYLVTGEEQKEKPLVNGDEELTEYLEILRTRPEMKMMFQLTKDATKADVEKAVKIIETMLGKD